MNKEYEVKYQEYSQNLENSLQKININIKDYEIIDNDDLIGKSKEIDRLLSNYGHIINENVEVTQSIKNYQNIYNLNVKSRFVLDIFQRSAFLNDNKEKFLSNEINLNRYHALINSFYKSLFGEDKEIEKFKNGSEAILLMQQEMKWFKEFYNTTFNFWESSNQTNLIILEYFEIKDMDVLEKMIQKVIQKVNSTQIFSKNNYYKEEENKTIKLLIEVTNFNDFYNSDYYNEFNEKIGSICKDKILFKN